MLKKLLKYDLKNMLKSISIFYLLSIVFAITTRILEGLNETIVVNIITQISMGIMFSMIASSIINTLMRNWVRFKQTIYGDESYLTHTLPVTKHQILTSKSLLSAINLLITFILCIISLLIAFYTKDNIMYLKDLTTVISTSIDINPKVFIVLVFIILYLEVYNIIISGYLGILLGHKKSNNKVGFSVLYGFITYILTQLIVLLCIYIIGLFNQDVMNVFTSNNLNYSIITPLIYTFTLIYIVIIYIVNIVSNKVFNKGVNVE